MGRFFETKSFYDKEQKKWQDFHYVDGELVNDKTYYNEIEEETYHFELEDETENLNESKNENKELMNCEECCEHCKTDPISDLIDDYIYEFVDTDGCTGCIEKKLEKYTSDLLEMISSIKFVDDRDYDDCKIGGTD